MLNLPNILTLSRIAIIPIVLTTFFFDSTAMRWTAVSLFTLAGVTDFFDGYLARRANQVSRLGRFLDPIADKLLVASVLLMLVGFGRVEEWSYIPAIVILLREILVSGLREFLAELRVGLPVTKLAKDKTTFADGSVGLSYCWNGFPHGKAYRRIFAVVSGTANFDHRLRLSESWTETYGRTRPAKHSRYAQRRRRLIEGQR